MHNLKRKIRKDMILNFYRIFKHNTTYVLTFLLNYVLIDIVLINLMHIIANMSYFRLILLIYRSY
ncbi:hypothetical protein LCGC14_0789650 [marine sediment metagenome]|uniref:Uncharacterized protein n=1 Tax=marine sediment metagenome TaxID=412755 RepID=A0A0F9SD05_9ZZZZ